MDDKTEKRGLYLEWDKDVQEAIRCLVLIANGVGWRQWEQHPTDTRGIVTERAANAIQKRINARLRATQEARLLREVAIGEKAYTLSWAVRYSPESALEINLDYPAHDHPGGTIKMAVERIEADTFRVYHSEAANGAIEHVRLPGIYHDEKGTHIITRYEAWDSANVVLTAASDAGEKGGR